MTPDEQLFLTTLMQCAQFVRDPAGRPHLYITSRLGVGSKFWLEQQPGYGACVSIGTANDRFALYAENESPVLPADVPARVTASLQTIVGGGPQTNVGLEVRAANAPKGNIGLIAGAQYSPDAANKVTPIVVQEESEGQPARWVVLGPNGITVSRGTIPAGPFVVSRDGHELAAL